MAFEFIVEDGTMVPNSNSYLTVEEADTYLAANIHAYPSWQAMDLLSQQQLLVFACRHLDQRAIWNGVLTSMKSQTASGTNLVAQWAVLTPTADLVEQSMRWPRCGVRDVDGFPIADNKIPKELKDACAEMARYLIASDRSLERPQDFLTELKAGDVTLRFRDSTLSTVPSEITFMVRGLGFITNGHTNFGKIRKV